ncbi:pilus assembly PilX N-terminal domain-containing protein [Candidatus Nomurabacteria bacterium]|nr:pilus assembly PilX N-terminal domain-containing protein [Candidatus Kaiserbacteria bacterium]MCB9814899.1 pilus assembly PilX N-terminal domain-containing protein [Candidatus Nomurabacteria bacterium]
MDKNKTESGFALLMTMIVVGAVISIGLSMLDLTLRQVRLSTNAKESEIAFHAANAGLECAQFWRRASSTEMESGSNISPKCFNVSAGSVGPTIPSSFTGDGNAVLYDYQFEWGPSGSTRCTKARTLIINSDVTGGGATVSNMKTAALFPAYPNTDKDCLPGSICTIISVQGYNKPCSTINTSYGVVQREVLLQL